ncbi:MAG: WYL domain-containing protein [Prevotellaceae bacterium]|jgi:predicted DNA-binding transcriptional regulator YafY|nr:WYL domain-containing protein [Prevotellaceae bacterium]
MSNIEVAKRHLLIINKMRRLKQSTFEDIHDYLQRESDISGFDYTVSKRTFARDIQDIGSVYGVYIKYDFSEKFYYIEEEYEPEINDRMLEAFDMYHVLKVQENQSPYFHLEKRRPQGLENLYGLLHAIKNRLQITFNYQKYYKDGPESRTVAPLVLKEFKNRWYLFAKNIHDEQIKCYALDRLFDLEISNIRFADDKSFDINEQLKHCFGIMSPNASKPSKVVLSFDAFAGKYIKSLPLHHSQKIIKDTDDELQISLTVYLTHDFIMELLSHGNTVKVISPQSLIDDLVNIYTEAIEKYEL